MNYTEPVFLVMRALNTLGLPWRLYLAEKKHPLYHLFCVRVTPTEQAKQFLELVRPCIKNNAPPPRRRPNHTVDEKIIRNLRIGPAWVKALKSAIDHPESVVASALARLVRLGIVEEIESKSFNNHKSLFLRKYALKRAMTEIG